MLPPYKVSSISSLLHFQKKCSFKQCCQPLQRLPLWPMCRMGEYQIHLPSEWNNQLRDAAAVKDKGHANHKQECPARYESTSNFVPELKMQLCALCQPICMDTWFFTSLFLSLSSTQTDFLNKRKRFVCYFCVFRKSQGEEQSQEKQPCVQPHVPGATLPN